MDKFNDGSALAKAEIEVMQALSQNQAELVARWMMLYGYKWEASPDYATAGEYIRLCFHYSAERLRILAKNGLPDPAHLAVERWLSRIEGTLESTGEMRISPFFFEICEKESQPADIFTEIAHQLIQKYSRNPDYKLRTGEPIHCDDPQLTSTEMTIKKKGDS